MSEVFGPGLKFLGPNFFPRQLGYFFWTSTVKGKARVQTLHQQLGDFLV
jgi:hypothetical protein